MNKQMLGLLHVTTWESTASLNMVSFWVCFDWLHAQHKNMHIHDILQTCMGDFSTREAEAHVHESLLTGTVLLHGRRCAWVALATATAHCNN